MIKFWLTLAIFCAATCASYKILLLSPVASRSHHNLLSALAKGLANVGHDVTIVTPYEDKYKPKNGSYREIILTGFIEDMTEKKKEINVFTFDTLSVVTKIEKLLTMGDHIAEMFFQHPNVRKLLMSNETFDATILEHFIFDALKGIPGHFNSHQVILCPSGSSSSVNHLVANPSLPSYTPDVMLGFPAKMNFRQRLTNTVVLGVTKVFERLHSLPTQNAILKKYLPNTVDVYDAMYNVSLLLLTSHFSLIHAENRVPNMIDIAGFHLKSPKKLPEDLQKYLDQSKNGVVYFSMGSVAESKTIPVETRNLILRSLGNLTEDVLWKWEEDHLPGQPKNVRIEKWLPQESILAHPNVKLFITHGGFLSIMETTYYGKPIVAIPIFADQIPNAKNAERNGVGRYVLYAELEEKKLTGLIKEVLSNPKFTETAKQKSALMRDRQVPPLETAIYWVEYVIRHNGAPHLRVAALDLSWYQYYLLDVIGFLVLVVWLTLFILKKAFSWLCCSKKKVSPEKIKRS